MDDKLKLVGDFIAGAGVVAIVVGLLLGGLSNRLGNFLMVGGLKLGLFGLLVIFISFISRVARNAFTKNTKTLSEQKNEGAKENEQ